MNSAAIGPGAVASQDNEVVLGTSSHSYQAPGITSSQSKSRQSGQLEIVTSDANGNLATDGGQFFNQLASLDNDLSTIDNRLTKLDRRTDENELGVALAMSMQNPDLVGNERFGMAANWGAFEGANALGMSLMGVLGNNFVTQNDRVAMSGGFGVGFSTDQRRRCRWRPRRPAMDPLSQFGRVRATLPLAAAISIIFAPAAIAQQTPKGPPAAGERVAPNTPAQPGAQFPQMGCLTTSSFSSLFAQR